MEGGTVKRKLPEECSSTDESKKLKHDQKSKVVNNGKKQVRKLTDYITNWFTFEELYWSLYSFSFLCNITRNVNTQGSNSGK